MSDFFSIDRITELRALELLTVYTVFELILVLIRTILRFFGAAI